MKLLIIPSFPAPLSLRYFRDCEVLFLSAGESKNKFCLGTAPRRQRHLSWLSLVPNLGKIVLCLATRHDDSCLSLDSPSCLTKAAGQSHLCCTRVATRILLLLSIVSRRQSTSVSLVVETSGCGTFLRILEKRYMNVSLCCTTPNITSTHNWCHGQARD